MRPEMAMAKTDQYIKSGFFAVLLYVSLAAGVNGYLKVGFYSSNCPAAESTVFEVVRDAFINNAEVSPGLVRMHFHDCFVRGCDGSVLIDSTAKNTAEKDSPANNPSLHGFDVIDRAKSRLETICPNTVSCADILAFAARDSAKLASPYEFSWDVPAGRRDGIISLSSDIPSNLPPPTFDVNQLTQRFASKGLSQEEMVILSGAHSFGISHCSSFLKRLYNFSNTFQTDPSLDPQYAQLLKQKCPQGSNGDPTVFMETITPETLDNFYYDGLNMNHGLFTSDATLLTNPNTRNLVHANCGHYNLRRWQISFAAAMVKMGMIIELTGNQGEIRHNCRVINS
jgi:peroxidase